ncbi:hypothetical protein AB0D04_09475 [Streptomyces sp. NPDC048483]|uniref:hypothetical protein n=1 Tax=Streptomyces sp. NPDC048483 TaxID=3154927 RepID=UPI0034451161
MPYTPGAHAPHRRPTLLAATLPGAASPTGADEFAGAGKLPGADDTASGASSVTSSDTLRRA